MIEIVVSENISHSIMKEVRFYLIDICILKLCGVLEQIL